MIFYTSDLHFHYEPLLSERPFKSVEEMDEVLIRNWNKTISSEDTVYVVGDIGYNDNRVPTDALRRLSGHKHLIRGNHDVGFDDAELLYDYFETVTDFNEIDDGDEHIILCHYPIIHNKRSVMVFGHLHADPVNFHDIIRTLPKLNNCGVDVNGYRPVTLNELKHNNDIFYHREGAEGLRPRHRRIHSGRGLMPKTPNFKPLPERPKGL